MITIVAVACLATASTTTIGCGGGGSSNPNSSTPAPTASPTVPRGTGSVSGNHPLPHVAVITAAQLSAGIGIALDISNGLHSHTVTLTGAQVMQVAAGERVSVESSRDTHSDGSNPHNHTVTFN